MSKLITICRDVEDPASTDCIDDHEDLEVPLIERCKVVRMDPCSEPNAVEHVGPEAESSAVWQATADDDCCDC